MKNPTSNIYDHRIESGQFCSSLPACSDGEDLLFCEFNTKQLFVSNFGISNIAEYPNKKPNRLIRQPLLLNSSKWSDHVLWHCNAGMYVRSKIDPPGFFCLCPNYYYGERCEFQRKRITLKLQLQAPDIFDHISPIFKFVVLVTRHSDTNEILSHEQFIYAPRQFCLPRYVTQLLYPINDSFSSFYNHSIYVHAFVAQTLEHHMSWQFPLSFEFLPVRRIVKRLVLPENPIKSLTIPTRINDTSCMSCSNTSVCLGYDNDTGRAICACPLHTIGHRCLIQFNSCREDSCNGHGKCTSTDIRYDANQQFVCSCDEAWHGRRCDKEKLPIHISFSREISAPLSNIVFFHNIVSHYMHEPVRYIYFHRLRKTTSNLTFYVEYKTNWEKLVFIQLYENSNQFEYYLLLSRKRGVRNATEINTEIRSTGRCRSINELFNKTVISQPPLRRVKNYQRPCLEQQLRCFYDDSLMCLCDETNHTNCFNFETAPSNALSPKCSGRGLYFQDNEICPQMAVCICEPCNYGSTCQYSMGGYSLSLDAIIGSFIIPTTTNIFQQHIVIRITVLVLSLLFLVGVICNIIGIFTFTQSATHESGCGLFLLVSSLIGFLTMIVLIVKVITMLVIKQTNISCSLMEFLLKWWSGSCEWLNACVAIDRTWAVIHSVNYSRAKSKKRARWMILFVLMLIAVLSSPELIFRRMVLDRNDEQKWCVLTLNSDRRFLFTLNSIGNILMFLLPLAFNLISCIVIIQRHVCFNAGNRGLSMLLKQIKKSIILHKHIVIAPMILGCLALPRVIFSFIFVCKKLDRQPYISFFAYCMSLIPPIAVLFAFILPSETYRTACHKIIKRIVNKCPIQLFFSGQATS
ncbi:unnamed protein product [Rotaria magnacalcarata]|uniref:EGF-like domain-containing protein n=1 Tax=Rotaria magnacalcarata TaxID=392030 RepID=A0A8S2KT21_9BILA|nr:unnamed protein product [Rotaria magnacalcarata]